MDKRKKIVHMTTVHHPFDTRIYHKECLSLAQAGFDVSLMTTIDETAIPDETPVTIIPLRKRGGRIRRMILSTWEAYRKAKKLNADCYHIHDPELLPVGWLLKSRHNTVIYDVHEDYITSITQKEYIAKPIRKLVAGFYSIVERFFSKKMELCLAEKYYQEKYPDGKCILNYPLINEKLIAHRVEHLPSEDELLYTGNVSTDRGAFIHAQIPKLNASVSVHFVGKCPGDLANAMCTVAGNEADRLHIEGVDTFIEREDIDAKYVEKRWLAGLALFPPTDHYMKKELTKFFEYMSAGLPIICSDFPLWKDFMAHYECGIAVDPDKPTEIANAIHYLQMNPDEAIRMGANGKKAVIEKLNWHHEEKKLIHWYNDLLGRETEILVSEQMD
ncbi:MAG TPA: glycosyltransferase [Virgibacillus sp.]|nr:glycosyltransferase [Virgibacillus sp.]